MVAEKRFETIFDNANDEIDEIVIPDGSKDKNFLYLTDAKNGVFEGCIAVLSRTLKLTVFTPKLEAQAIKESCEDAEVIEYESGNDLKEKLEEKLADRTIGINFASTSISAYKHLKKLGVKIKDVSKAFEKAREVKDEEEIRRIETAQTSCLKAFKQIEKRLEGRSITEMTAAGELELEMKKNGITATSFTTITAFGKNSAMPHYQSGNAKLEKNDIALFDFGGMFENYASDATRTLILGNGKETKKFEEMRQTVEDAKQAAFELIKEGADARSIDKAARDLIDNTKFKGKFIHALGHSVGLEVHDGFGISTGSDFELKEGMVITIEPGVYVEGVGGYRSEDIVVVTNKGARWLR